ncbi:MAG: molybdopterin cofactor-binding domain-containing protein [Caldilineaceae bacterium]
MPNTCSPARTPNACGWKVGRVHAPDGRAVTLSTVALHSTHQAEQHQIMATASHMSYVSPAPFAAQYAEVEVDTETGQVTAKKIVMAVDCGVAINPITATGQVEGGMIQALGYALSEDMVYDELGRLQTTKFGDYRIYAADEVPRSAWSSCRRTNRAVLRRQSRGRDPHGRPGPGHRRRLFDATGARIRQIQFTPERVWRALTAH